jgi:hypothetical protein
VINSTSEVIQGGLAASMSKPLSEASIQSTTPT